MIFQLLPDVLVTFGTATLCLRKTAAYHDGTVLLQFRYTSADHLEGSACCNSTQLQYLVSLTVCMKQWDTASVAFRQYLYNATNPFDFIMMDTISDTISRLQGKTNFFEKRVSVKGECQLHQCQD